MPIEKIDSLRQAIHRMQWPMSQYEFNGLLRGIVSFLDTEYAESARELKSDCERFIDKSSHMDARENRIQKEKLITAVKEFREATLLQHNS